MHVYELNYEHTEKNDQEINKFDLIYDQLLRHNEYDLIILLHLNN